MLLWDQLRAVFAGINRSTWRAAAIGNRIRQRRAHARGTARLEKVFPRQIHIEFTNACNLRCVMCSRKSMTRPIGMMKPDLFRKIIAELKEHPVEDVFLGGQGEALIHPQFSEFLEIARSSGLNLTLSTNGVLLSEKHARALIGRADLLIISYESQDPAVYSKIRPGGDHAALERNIESFLRLKGKQRPVTVIQSLEFPGRPSQKTALLERWKEFDALVATRPAHNWLGDDTEINQITLAAPARDPGRCDQAWRHAIVYWDGRMGPCCNFYDAQVTFGDLNGMTFAEAWNSQAAVAFRKRQSELPRQRIPECASCQLPAPHGLSSLALTALDVATINRILFGTDGWRD